jgi:hypothetical protein
LRQARQARAGKPPDLAGQPAEIDRHR